jgi:hypothetical protein
VLLKGIPRKDYDESNVRKVIYDSLADFLSPKELKTRKVIKNIQLVKEEENPGKNRVHGSHEPGI